MPLRSWLKGWVTPENQQLPAEKDSKTVVSDSLMLELESQIRQREQDERDTEAEERKKQTGVDYSWLVSKPPKKYELPQMDRLELEELCSQVKPEECCTVINMFRDGLLRRPPLYDYPRILRTIIRQVMDTRPREKTVTDKVRENLGKVRPGTKVTPVNHMDSLSSGETPVLRLGELPHGISQSSSEMSSFDTSDEKVLFKKTIDDLPV